MNKKKKMIKNVNLLKINLIRNQIISFSKEIKEMLFKIIKIKNMNQMKNLNIKKMIKIQNINLKVDLKQEKIVQV